MESKRSVKLLFVLLAFIPSVSFSQGFTFNVGFMSLGPIPVVLTELEYKYTDGAIRINYFSNYKVGFFGSSKYDGLSVEYSFNETEVNGKFSNYYVSLGAADKTGGSSEDADYEFVGIGYERKYNKNMHGRFGQKSTFVRYFVNYLQEKEKTQPTITENDSVYPGISLGLRF